MNIIAYLNVENLSSGSEFFCDVLQLFALQPNNEIDEVVLNHLLIPGFRLVLRASTIKADGLNFSLSIQVENCRPLFDKLSNAQPGKFEWKVSNEFFGTYLSSPIGEQFAIKNALNTKILFYSET